MNEKIDLDFDLIKDEINEFQRAKKCLEFFIEEMKVDKKTQYKVMTNSNVGPQYGIAYFDTKEEAEKYRDRRNLHIYKFLDAELYQIATTMLTELVKNGLAKAI